MKKAFGVKYIFSIMDIFSQKVMIYPLNNEEARNIIPYIIDFCSHNSFPKEFSSDNGAEFKNKLFEEYCSLNNIKFINGVPFKPYSKGIIVLFNYTIKKYLTKKYIANGKKI